MDYERIGGYVLAGLLGHTIMRLVGTILAARQIPRVAEKLQQKKHVRLRLSKKKLEKLIRMGFIPEQIPIFRTTDITQIGSFYIPPKYIDEAIRVDKPIREYLRSNRNLYERAKRFGLVVVPKYPHLHIMLHEYGHGRSYIGEGSKTFRRMMDYVVPIMTSTPIVRPLGELIRLIEEYQASRFAKNRSRRLAEAQRNKPVMGKRVRPEEIEDSWDVLWPAFKTYLYTSVLPALGLVGGLGAYYLIDKNKI